MNDNWNLVADHGTVGVLDADDVVNNANDAHNPGAIVKTLGVDAFGTVTTGALTGTVAGYATIDHAISLVGPSNAVRILEGTYSDGMTLFSSSRRVAVDVGEAIINGPITASMTPGTFTKDGVGMLTVTAANTIWRGSISIIAGTLKQTNASGLGIANVTIGNGATLEINNVAVTSNNLTLNNGATLLGSGAGASYSRSSNPVIANGATVTFGAAAPGDVLTIGSGYANGSPGTAAPTINVNNSSSFAGTVVLNSGSNNFRASWILQGGTLRTGANNNVFGNPIALGSLSGSTLTANGGNLKSNVGNTALSYDAGTGTSIPLTLNTNLTITQSRSSNGAAQQLTFGSLFVGAASPTLTLTYDTTASSAITSGTAAFVFGNTTLAGATMAQGNLTLNTNQPGTPLTSATFGAMNDQGTARTISKGGPGTMTLGSAAGSLVYTTVNVTGGTLNSNNATALGSGANVVLSTGATFSIGATQTIAALNNATVLDTGSVVLNGNTLTLGNTSGPGSIPIVPGAFRGVISSAGGGLVKTGGNVQSLSGANTYSGPTTVNGGTLLVDGSLSSAVTVNNGGVLGGSGNGTSSGVISGSVAVNNGGVLDPGDVSVNANLSGRLTVNGDVNFNPGSIYRLELNGTDPGASYDQLVVNNGGVAISAISPISTLSLVTPLGYSPSAGDTATIISHTGSGNFNGTFNYSATAGFRPSYSIANQINLIQNSPPVFTSLSTPTVSENSSSVVALAADDIDGDVAAFSITGGADATKFSIGPANLLQFNIAPDFESPTGHGSNANHYLVSVIASDGFGGTTIQNLDVNVVNINESPSVLLSGPNSANEGDAKHYTFVTIDSDAGDTLAVQAFSGGAFGVVSNLQFTPSTGAGSFDVTFLDGPATSTVSVQVKDVGNLVSNNSAIDVGINNVAPTIEMGSDATVNEGEIFALQSNEFIVHDPGSDTITSFTVHWGDGSDTGTMIGSPIGAMLQHAYADGGPAGTVYQVTMDLLDEDGTFLSAGSLSVTVDDLQPTINLGGSLTANEGELIGLQSASFTVNDPGTDTISSFTLHWGDGTDTGVVSGTPIGSVLQHTYADGSAAGTLYHISIDLTDEDGIYQSAGGVDVTINNVAPTATISSDGPIQEGHFAAVSLSNPLDLSSPDTAAGLRYSFATSLSGLAATYAVASSSDSGSFPFADDGIRIVYGRIFDKDGGASTYSISIVVENVLPLRTITHAAYADLAGNYSIDVHTADPGDDTVSHFDVDWGDGAVENSLAAAPRLFNAGVFQSDTVLSHTYTSLGPKQVVISTYDEDGSCFDIFAVVVVENSPHAQQTAVPNPARLGVPVVLDGSASSQSRPDRSIAQYFWDFGDGGTYSETSADAADGAFDGVTTHNYGAAGSYSVVLTVSDDNSPAKSDSVGTLVVINSPPVAVVAGGDRTINVGNALVLDASGSFDPDSPSDSIVSYSWYLDDQSTALVTSASAVSVADWSALASGGVAAGQTHSLRLVAIDSRGQVSINSASFQLSVTATAEIPGGSGNDVLTVDFTVGTYSLNGGPPQALIGLTDIAYDGGAGNDALVVKSPTGGSVIYDFENTNDGSVVVDGLTIHYVGLEPIVDTGSAGDVVFNLPNGADQVVLEDDGSGSFQLRSSNATFETTIFNVPSHSFTIRGGAGDTLTVTKSVSIPSAGSSITLNVPTIALDADLAANTISGSAATVTVLSPAAQMGDAIVLAAAGADINVAADIYNETVDASNKSLTLRVSGAPGIVRIHGGLILGAADTLEFTLEGTTAGSAHDQIVVDGNVVLAGATLSPILSYSPAPGDAIAVLKHTGTGSINGTFNYAQTAGFRASYSNPNEVNIIQNRSPLANAGGPYTISVGGSLSLNAGQSDDPDVSLGDSLSFSWDVGGTANVRVDSIAAIPWSELQSLGITSVGAYIGAIVLHVNDALGLSSTLAVDLNVTSSVPTGNFSRLFDHVDEGSTNVVQFTNQFDPTSAGIDDLRYAYDFDTDGVFDLGGGDYGNSVSSALATVSSSFLMRPGQQIVRGRIIAPNGTYSDYTTSFTVSNVAPQVAVPSTANFGAGVPFAVAGSFSDSPLDGNWKASADFGDATGIQAIAVDQTTKTFVLYHTYAAAGNYDITVYVTDLADSNFHPTALSLTGTGTIHAAVNPTTLQVINFTQAVSGFDIQFNRPIEISDLALYGGGQFAQPITVIGNASGPVRGSLVWEAATNTAHWVKTGGPLATDVYRVKLVSGTTGNTFHDSASNIALDGDGDGTSGDNYVRTGIDVISPAARVLSMPDFARGQGQSVIVNEHGTQGNIIVHGPITAATGLPIFISDGAGVKQIDFVLHFDPALLQPSTALTNLAVPVNWTANATLTSPGSLHIVAVTTDGSDLGTGPQIVITLKNANVPNNAAYGATEMLSLSDVAINGSIGSPIPAVTDLAVHKAVDLGDVTGDGTVGGGDAAAIAQIVVGKNSGFQNAGQTVNTMQLVDPVIVDDVTGDGTTSGLDAADCAQMFVNPASQPQIPIPLGARTSPAGGIDPTVRTGLGHTTAIVAVRSQPVNVAITITDSAATLLAADISITYDTALLDLTAANVTLAANLQSQGWSFQKNVSDAAGRMTVSAYGTTPLSSGPAALLNLMFAVPASVGGTSPLNAVGRLNEDQLTMTADNGTVIVPPLLGDWNRDGQRTSSDIQAMQSALTDLDRYTLQNSLTQNDLLTIGDINHDSLVNNRDLQAMLNLVIADSGGGSTATAVPASKTATATNIPSAGIRSKFQTLPEVREPQTPTSKLKEFNGWSLSSASRPESLRFRAADSIYAQLAQDFYNANRNYRTILPGPRLPAVTLNWDELCLGADLHFAS